MKPDISLGNVASSKNGYYTGGIMSTVGDVTTAIVEAYFTFKIIAAFSVTCIAAITFDIQLSTCLANKTDRNPPITAH